MSSELGGKLRQRGLTEPAGEFETAPSRGDGVGERRAEMAGLPKARISLALWNLRSIHNVASILRTADGFAVDTVYFIGTTPHPTLKRDSRLSHVRTKMDRVFAKTSLGAEKSLNLLRYDCLEEALATIDKPTQIIALEQSPDSHVLPDLPKLKDDVLLIIGEERHGLPPEILKLCDSSIEIKMQGIKESLNVSVATGIALYSISQS
ncbi:hypothetical protein FWC63_01710 [Candidatus Saccharibacteria bacterium]|nr:hypothetical protein [Candidatus Saccharibacteria bacterium]